ncbi:MAG: GAF domain-containing protein [Myxococcota bacterium]
MTDGAFEQMSELAKLVERAAEFGRNVMQENLQLKQAVRQLERKLAASRPPAGGPAPVADAGGDLQEELNALRRENAELAQSCVQLETENDNLLNFYVASHELHSTLKVREVLMTIKEIVINLIGADRFAIYIDPNQTGELTAAEGEGMDLRELAPISLTADPVGRSLAARSIFVAEAPDPSKTELIAGVPLAVEERILGAIMIYGLLEQKDGFGELDHGLFALLAQHAGTALMAALLYTTSERRRTTFEAATRLLLENDP